MATESLNVPDLHPHPFQSSNLPISHYPNLLPASFQPPQVQQTSNVPTMLSTLQPPNPSSNNAINNNNSNNNTTNPNNSGTQLNSSPMSTSNGPPLPSTPNQNPTSANMNSFSTPNSTLHLMHLPLPFPSQSPTMTLLQIGNNWYLNEVVRPIVLLIARQEFDKIIKHETLSLPSKLIDWDKSHRKWSDISKQLQLGWGIDLQPRAIKSCAKEIRKHLEDCAEREIPMPNAVELLEELRDKYPFYTRTSSSSDSQSTPQLLNNNSNSTPLNLNAFQNSPLPFPNQNQMQMLAQPSFPNQQFTTQVTLQALAATVQQVAKAVEDIRDALRSHLKKDSKPGSLQLRRRLSDLDSNQARKRRRKDSELGPDDQAGLDDEEEEDVDEEGAFEGQMDEEDQLNSNLSIHDDPNSREDLRRQTQMLLDKQPKKK